MDPSSCQWSSLPRNLLSKIGQKLQARIDVLRFRAVCPAWRSSISLPPPHSPLKLPFPIGPNRHLNPDRRGHFLLMESTIYALHPLTKISNTWSTTNTWLIKIEEAKPGKVFLKDPLSRDRFENLTKSLPRVLNLLDYRVIEISKAYGLEFIEHGKSTGFEFNELKSIMIKKVVVSSSLSNMGHDFVAIALHTGGKLGVWRMGDDNWSNIEDNRERSHYDDIVYHNGKFYAVDFTGLIVTVDPASLEITEIAPAMPRSAFGYGGQYKYLVASFGDLFMVEKYCEEERDFCCSSDSEDDLPVCWRVYKINEEKPFRVQVDELEDRALFIGDDNSFSISSKDFAGCKENSIYFTDTMLYVSDDVHPGFGVGIFDMMDDTAGPLSKFPGCSKIFWPPPTWLKTNTEC